MNEAIDTAVGGALAGALGLGGLGDLLDDVVQTTLVDAETAAAAGGDLQVQLQSLVTLYNDLSRQHTDLAEHFTTMNGRVQQLSAQKVGSGVTGGVNAAWSAVYESAGHGAAPNSLLGNMKSVDSLLVSHMAAALHNAQGYAEQENLVVSELGKAAAGPGTSSGAQ